MIAQYKNYSEKIIRRNKNGRIDKIFGDIN